MQEKRIQDARFEALSNAVALLLGNVLRRLNEDDARMMVELFSDPFERVDGQPDPDTRYMRNVLEQIADRAVELKGRLNGDP